MIQTVSMAVNVPEEISDSHRPMRSQSGPDQLLDHHLLYVHPYTKRSLNRTDTSITVNIFSDAIIMALPITMVSQLQMKMKQKIGVASMFALGFFVIIASSTSSTIPSHMQC